jgi:hypothetical protein
MDSSRPVVLPWASRRVFSGLEARQFEFNHAEQLGNVSAFGTVQGAFVVGDHDAGVPLGAVRSAGVTDRDPVLAICWLRQSSTRVVTGSSRGAIRLVDAAPVLGGGSVDAAEGLDGVAGAALPTPAALCAPPNATPSEDMLLDLPELPTVRTYPRLKELTCVHVSCDDRHILTSGYRRDVNVVDLETGALTRTLHEPHSQHINISRFACTSPNLFCTSSFDKTIKVWDLRVGHGTAERPIFTVLSKRGNVTISFSPDDHFLLTSAVDNEVRLYLAADGRQVLRLAMEETGRADCYTRAYFCDGGRTVVSGASEESLVRLHSATTGEPLATHQLYDGRPSAGTLYVQSLRGHPHRPGFIGVLANDRDYSHPIHMLTLHARGYGLQAERVAVAAATGVAAGGAAPPPQSQRSWRELLRHGTTLASSTPTSSSSSAVVQPGMAWR